MSYNDFIHKEINKLPENDNSSIWPVAKIGTDEQGKPKRKMVLGR